MRHPELTSTSEPRRCPRCGYDQRGVVETWEESCPLSGRCTECGLDFAWWEVMRPDLRLPAWCIEYAERKGDLPWAAVRTFIASWWPWYFWSRLRMSHPARWGRIRLLLALLLLAILVGYALAQAAAGTRVWILEEWAFLFPVLATGGWIVLYLLLPLSFVLLPVSRRRAKVRWRHVIRVGAYSFMLPLFLLALYSLMLVVGTVMPEWPLLSKWLEAGYSLMLVAISWVPPLFLPLWWWAAIRQHLRMPHALAVSILLTVMCFLLSWIVTGTIVALIIWLFE